jgi:hypothetical protein
MLGWEGKERDWSYISTFFSVEDEGTAGRIDERTWEDLDLGAVFRAIDRTRSSVGQAALYRLLRTPVDNPEAWAARARTIGSLTDGGAERQRIAKTLGKLGFQKDGEIYGFFSYIGSTIQDSKRFIFPVLGILAVLSLAAPVFLGLSGIVVIAGITILNFVVHFSHKAEVEVESPSFAYLHRLLVAAERLSRLEAPALRPEQARLQTLLPGLRMLKSRTRFLFGGGGLSGDIAEMFAEYIKILFLLEVSAYFFSHNEMIRRMAALKEVYRIVGEADALTAVASFRAESPACITPEITAGTRLLDARDIVHPLLPEPVANSVRLDGRGMIVTGSNMSGKSTFLRTIGVNQVLAVTLCTAFARGYRASFFLTVSSITSRDSIQAGESHYLVEAKRMLFILNALKEKRPLLVIIDEILSGTNSEERIVASIRILTSMARSAGLIVAATHDRGIAAALTGLYANSHFTHVIGEAAREAAARPLEFDYVLRDGIVERGNAIRLLAHIGFPPEITGEVKSG